MSKIKGMIIGKGKKKLLFPTQPVNVEINAIYLRSKLAIWILEKFKMCLHFDPGLSLLEIGHKEIIRNRWKDLTTKMK